MILNYYNNIYSPELWVATEKDIALIQKNFNGYSTIFDLQAGSNPYTVIIDEQFGGITFLVRSKRKNKPGILILLNSEDLTQENYSYITNTIAHESVHAADAVYQYIGQATDNFDNRNEPYAYLVGWVAGCIGDYLTKYFKEHGGEEVR